ncbi:hypothetical protein C2845_PM01G47800 [Panicum miliaceum]|uniref:Uncharacterized protein n=1 Tax=Panicum miliaceum TaxID=4540 RepID=A0A3L6TIQ0_PANMI|nr:hypothetical protein C2845_PM01G47800 [Panicum miliaceum]
MALRAYVVTASGGRYMERRERLGHAVLEAILSGGVDETACALRAPPGSAGEGLWKLLVDRSAGMANLEKLEDGKDLAMAEAVSKELRNLVTDHGSDLWKAKYEAIGSFCPYDFRKHPSRAENKNMPLNMWKQGYVKARRSKSCLLKRQQSEPNPMPRIIPPIDPTRIVRCLAGRFRLVQ